MVSSIPKTGTLALILAAAFCFLPVSWIAPCPAQETPLDRDLLEDKNAHWEINAEKMTYVHEKNLYIAEGDVTITRNGQKLTAQRGVYNKETGIVQVTGDVRLTANGDILTGETALMDLNSQFGQITRGRIFLRENHYYIYGSAMVRTGPNTYLVKDCRITTCDGDRPDWSITGSEVEVTLEGYGSVRDAAFRIKDFPVFYLPYAVFPAKTERQTGLLPPRLGYSNLSGVDIEVPFFWAFSESADATFYERYMTERGFMQGLELRYVAEEDSRGTFLFDVMRDRVEEKDMDDPDQAGLSPFDRTNRTRYWFRSRADQTFAPGLEARLDTDYVSDQDYIKEFQGGLLGFKARPELSDYGRPVEETRSPTRRSALRISRDDPDYSLQATAAYHQRPENPALDDTAQPLAGANFSLLPRKLPDLPLFLGVETDYGYVWRDFGEKGHRFSIGPDLSYPMWFGRYLRLDTYLGYEHVTQWVDGDPDWSGSQSENAYHAGAELSTTLEKTFDIQWREFTGLKHKIVPSLAYDFRSHRDRDRHRPWFELIDDEGDLNILTLAVENILDSRKDDPEGGVHYAQWGTFTLSQGYSLGEARRDEEPWRRKRPWEPLVTELNLFPFPSLDLDGEMHWDHYENDVTFGDMSLELSLDRAGGRKDRFALEYIYEEDRFDTIGYRINVNLGGGFAVGTALRKDLEFDHTMESSYWLDYRAQCWGLRLSAGSLDGIDSVMLQFQLLGLGDTGAL